MCSAKPAASLNRAAAFVREVAGWRRAALACGAGVASTLALPPLHLLPFLFVAFVVLVLLIEASPSARAAFALGWWFGVGQFASGLYWIAHALLVDAERFGWLVPFAVGGLSAGLAIFTAIAVVLARSLGKRGEALVVALAASWAAMEWLRGTILTGFPWNPMSSAWIESTAVAQSAALFGAYGLSLVTVQVAAAPATLAASAGARPWSRLRPTVLAALVLATLHIGGWMRIADVEDSLVPGIRLRIVQGNIEQALKWRPEQAEASFQRYLRLSASLSDLPVTHVIWPETAAPILLTGDPVRRAAIGAVVPPGGLALIGVIRAEFEGGRVQRAWNSLQALDPAGSIVGTYDKFHLVPFGEYMPFRAYLAGFEFIPGSLDFSTGPGVVTLDLPGLPAVGPLICYEVIFPGEVVNPDRRPMWLLNLTNDAWFGHSSGPYQHLASARMRAIEEGLPLVRAANTGISAVIDPYGRVVASLGLGREGIIDSALPRPLASLTMFASYGNWITGVLIAAMALVAAWAGRRPKS